MSKVDSSIMSNERVMFLLNSETGVAPFAHEFLTGGADPQILSGLVSAMASFMGQVTGQRQTSWKTVYGQDSLIVEESDWIVGVIVVSKETVELRSKLRRVVKEFEDTFELLKHADGFEGGVFDEFDQYVRRVFLDDRVCECTEIFKEDDWLAHSKKYKLPSIAFRVVRFLYHTENGQSLLDATNAQGINMEEAKDLLSQAVWHNAVYLNYLPADGEILSLSSEASSIVLHKENTMGLSPYALKVVTALDGRTPLSDFLQEYSQSIREFIRRELASLINTGYIQRIPIEQRFVFVNECILNGLVQDCSRSMGVDKTRVNFMDELEAGISDNPWLGRIELFETMLVQSRLNETMTPSDLDSMCEAIEHMTIRMQTHLARVIGNSGAKTSLDVVRKSCHKRWAEFFSDLML